VGTRSVPKRETVEKVKTVIVVVSLVIRLGEVQGDAAARCLVLAHQMGTGAWVTGQWTTEATTERD
jgi:hypothetical protein